MRVLLRVLLLLGAVGLASLVRFGSNNAAIVALLGSNVVLLVILSSRYDSSFHSSLSQLCDLNSSTALISEAHSSTAYSSICDSAQ